jgi:DNA-binding MarR family transcriptional regulator
MEQAAADLSDEAITAWARLVRVSGRLLQQVEADLKAAEMPPLAWYDALLELKRAGAHGVRPFQLQDEMLLPQYNTSRLLDRIVKAGYAERLACADDGRGQVVRITAEGRALLRKMWPVYRAAIARHFSSRLAKQDAAALSQILARLKERVPGNSSGRVA